MDSIAQIQGLVNLAEAQGKNARLQYERYSELQAAFDALVASHNALAKRVAALEASTPDMPPPCKAGKCSYYSHYLALGPADLTHMGYHTAEAKCAEAQALEREYSRDNEYSETDSRRRFLEKQCERWETATRC